jgi:two-component system, OmpR family, alkaline phosphatase synthesis response regulator PhoP
VTPPVVVADDSPTILELIVLTLERGGIESVTAEDGVVALERIREHSPRLVILDAMMPNADGYEVCRTLRADDALEQPHVIMLTANAREVDRERAEEAGVSEFMTKPFSPKALRARVQELLESEE